ncbi:MAG: hypothetical protein AAF432_02710 [Planctomycetota bacterium]
MIGTRRQLGSALALICLLCPIARAEFKLINPGESIQAAIDDVNTVDGDIILVLPGVYSESINFHGKQITLRGANGSAFTTINVTILNDRAFTFTSGENENAIVEGFTIGGGSSTIGGAVFINGAQPTFIDCTLIANASSGSGGAVACLGNASPTFIDCAFRNNEAARGGAVSVAALSSATFVDCLFAGNLAIDGGAIAGQSEAILELVNCSVFDNVASADGGAIHGEDKVDIRVRDCVIRDNEAIDEGGGIYLDLDADAVLVNTTLTCNKAVEGGGIYVEASDLEAVGCIIDSNTATTLGGAVHTFFASSTTMTNCTLFGNQAGLEGGGVFITGVDPTITNSILWANLDSGPRDTSSQIFSSLADPVVNFSCVEGGWPGAGGLGIVIDSPMFENAAESDFALSSASACLNVGNNDALPADVLDVDDDSNVIEPLPLDAAGAIRISNSIVDLGALERSSIDPDQCIADCSPINGDGTIGNGVVNIDDVLGVINTFGMCPPAPESCFCDLAPDNGDGTIGNGVINIDDLLVVINEFGPCPGG